MCRSCCSCACQPRKMRQVLEENFDMGQGIATNGHLVHAALPCRPLHVRVAAHSHEAPARRVAMMSEDMHDSKDPRILPWSFMDIRRAAAGCRASPARSGFIGIGAPSSRMVRQAGPAMPRHLAHPPGCFRRRMNACFPIPPAFWAGLTRWPLDRAASATIRALEAIAPCMPGTLAAMSVLEHLFMALPIRSETPWTWSRRTPTPAKGMESP